MKCIGQKAAITLIGGEVASDKVKMGKIEEFYAKAISEAGQEEVSAMVQSIHKPDVSCSDCEYKCSWQCSSVLRLW